MQNAIYAAAALAVILLLAALVVVWARRDVWLLRHSAIPLAIVGTLISTTIIGSTLGHAVPMISGLTAPSGEFSVLSVRVIRDDGIYITLDLPEHPKLFWTPWNKTTAERLQEMISDPENAGVMATVPPFEWSWETREPEYQALPQPKWMPDKPDQEEQQKQVPRFVA